MTLTREEFFKAYGGSDEKYRYMLLDRMRSDCEYVLGTCKNNPVCYKYLWACNDPKEHITYMRYLWESFAEKPEWLSMEEIDEYERRFSA